MTRGEELEKGEGVVKKSREESVEKLRMLKIGEYYVQTLQRHEREKVIIK